MSRYNGLGDRENDNPLPGERAFSNYSVFQRIIFFQSGTSQMLMGLCGCYSDVDVEHASIDAVHNADDNLQCILGAHNSLIWPDRILPQFTDVD